MCIIQSEISAFCNITTAISSSSWLNLEVLSPSTVAKSGPGFVLINVHTRGPVKDFQVCIQADTKKVEKPTKCASRVKYLHLVTFTAVWWSSWVQNSADFRRKFIPNFVLFWDSVYYNLFYDSYYKFLLKIVFKYFSKGRMMSYNLSNQVIFHSCFANVTASYFSLLPDAR